MDTTSVILAVASPPGPSLRGIVRVSGAETRALVRPHLDVPAWRRGVFRARLDMDGLELPCLAVLFAAPRSYTGQDAVEMQLPGNPDLLERVIDFLIASGRDRGLETRRAEAGEFTARAFLNGRMTLTQAEGVAATIAAASDAQLRAARLLLDGSLGALAVGLADQVAGVLALVEAGIDFTDQEDVVAIEPDALRDRLTAVVDRLDEQLDRSVGTEQLEAIPRVVLTGRPNAGKSTLFNTLLGHPRAVVSHVPGTTRDVLAEPLEIPTPHGPAEVMLVDLAGAETPDSTLGEQMQTAAKQALERADLILHCVAVDEPADRVSAREVVVRTKTDLRAGTDAEGDVAVSAVSGAGLDRLAALMASRLADRAVSLAADAVALRPRHEAALGAARRNLSEALELVGPERSRRVLDQPEVVAAAIRLALNDLGELGGDVTSDDVLGRIFATFCVGK